MTEPTYFLSRYILSFYLGLVSITPSRGGRLEKQS